MVVQKGTVGVWNGTAVRLFKVETVAATGPSLMKVRASRFNFHSSYLARICKTCSGSKAGFALLDAFSKRCYYQRCADWDLRSRWER